jgi:regulator of protease activity HflC (stomatin/prohibitin superfamily)
MATVVGEESEQQRMENEAKAKEEAEAANSGSLPPLPQFLTHQDFAEYMRMSDQRQRMLIENQGKLMQYLMDRNREG